MLKFLCDICNEDSYFRKNLYSFLSGFASQSFHPRGLLKRLAISGSYFKHKVINYSYIKELEIPTTFLYTVKPVYSGHLQFLKSVRYIEFWIFWGKKRHGGYFSYDRRKNYK